MERERPGSERSVAQATPAVGPGSNDDPGWEVDWRCVYGIRSTGARVQVGQAAFPASPRSAPDGGPGAGRPGANIPACVVYVERTGAASWEGAKKPARTDEDMEGTTVSTRIRTALTAGGLVVALVVAATGLETIRQGHAAETVSEATTASAQAGQQSQQSQETPGLETLSRAFRKASQEAMASVVYVQVEAERRVASILPFGNQGQPETRPQYGSGSGVIFRADGYVLTNNHVIEGATRVRVTLQDGREFSAEVVGRDPRTDIAVVRIDAADLPAAQLGNADDMQVGDWVVALGYPLSLGSTATAGIVSAKGRSLGILEQNGEVDRGMTLEAFLQTDAAINPGNSGGPLVDLEGRVIGINTAIASRTGYYQGYGFAVPVNLAKRVADDLIEHGEYRRPRLGVAVQTLSPADVEVYRLPSNKGAEVIQVDAGGPGEKAGLHLGDVIVSLDSKPVEDSNQLIEMLAVYQPGQEIDLELYRDGRKRSIGATLDVFETGRRAERVVSAPREEGMSKLGFAAANLTERLAERFNLQSPEGVVVTDVNPRSGAAPYLQAGVVIERVNGTPIKTIDDLEKVSRDAREGAAVSIVVRLPDGTQRIANYRPSP
jgi:serine protease Do